jgi:hypothetical protein
MIDGDQDEGQALRCRGSEHAKKDTKSADGMVQGKTHNEDWDEEQWQCLLLASACLVFGSELQDYSMN